MMGGIIRPGPRTACVLVFDKTEKRFSEKTLFSRFPSFASGASPENIEAISDRAGALPREIFGFPRLIQSMYVPGISPGSWGTS